MSAEIYKTSIKSITGMGLLILLLRTVSYKQPYEVPSSQRGPIFRYGQFTRQIQEIKTSFSHQVVGTTPKRS
jgi:regulator of protease activity HflC (stomatin/prohibitin superfamily)